MTRVVCRSEVLAGAGARRQVEAAGKTDAGVMGTPNSRFAMPYPRSYTGTPFWLMTTRLARALAKSAFGWRSVRTVDPCISLLSERRLGWCAWKPHSE